MTLRHVMEACEIGVRGIAALKSFYAESTACARASGNVGSYLMYGNYFFNCRKL